MKWSASVPEKLELWGRSRPSRFGEISAEVEALTSGAAFLPLTGFDWVCAKGKDVISFLQGLLSSDVRAAKENQAQPSWALDAKGRILFEVVVFRRGNEEVLLHTHPQNGDALVAHLDRYLIMEDVTLERLENMSCWTLQGPLASEVRERMADREDGLWLTHDRCGQGGYDLVCPDGVQVAWGAALLTTGAIPIGFEALNRVRTQAFIPWFQVDLTAGTNPLIYGSLGRVSATKGCFIGQETVAKTRDRGRPPKLLVLLEGEAHQDVAANTSLSHEDGAIGAITSAVASPDGSATLAFALVKTAVAKEDASFQDEQGRLWRVRHASKVK
jgi:folate-binding protein YgfZ